LFFDFLDEYLIHPDELDIPTYRRSNFNPFDLGPVSNCIDFWRNGDGPLRDISWFNIYNVPPHLLDRALKRSHKNSHTSTSNNDATSPV
jgi:hypothetical protein